MIKDMMVRLDSSAADELRLAAVKGIADVFDSQVIALFLNVLPVFGAAERDGIGATQAAELMRRAREGGDRIEAELLQRLARLQMRRFDDFSDAISDIAVREARAADTFVALRPNDAPEEPEGLIEGVCSAPAVVFSWFPGASPLQCASITFSSHGTAAASPRAHWPRRCRICTRRTR
jgi:hypothetical protein